MRKLMLCIVFVRAGARTQDTGVGYFCTYSDFWPSRASVSNKMSTMPTLSFMPNSKSLFKRLFCAVVAVMALLSPSCSPSPDEASATLERRHSEWEAHMNEAFPDRTQDTVELRRRLEYFCEVGNPVGQRTMLRALGNDARNSSLFGRAIEHHMAALALAYEIGDTVYITTMLNELGTDFRRIGAYEEAMYYHYQSLEMSEAYCGRDTADITRNMASSHNGIGVVYSAMNERAEAVRSYGNALEIETEKQNHLGMAMNYANIGSVFLDEEDYDKAMENFRLSLEYNERVGSTIGIGLCNHHIGTVHEKQGDCEKALEQYLKAYDILEGTDTWHWVKACFSVGETYISLGDHRRAKPYLDDGLRAAIGINAPAYIEQAYALLSQYWFAAGDFRRSAEELWRSVEWGDTVRNRLESYRLLEPRIRYETGRFTRQIEELHERNRVSTARRKNTLLLFLPIVTMLVVLLLFFLLRNRMERRKAAQIRELERMRSNFFTNITHELRNPVTVINGLIDHMLSDVEDEDNRQTKVMNAIRRQVSRLMRLVNQLLEFSRSEAGVNLPKWRCGDMSEFLRIVAEPYAQYAKSRGIELFVYNETESLTMNFAPSSMRKVMGNLLSNAIKHCGEGDRIILHFRHDPASGCCSILVKDSGSGIAPENMPHIFELYYTTGGNMGSGIGLALSKQLVEEIGGTITVASTLGKGTEFTVSLPVSVTAIPEDEREILDESEASSVYSETTCLEYDGGVNITAGVPAGGKKTVLIVEDNRDVAHYMSTILDGKYNILHASNGSEGLRIAEKHIPDLIISDVMMPEKDGYAFTAELRANLAVSHIPVIMITAKGTTEDKLEGLKAGADAYLPKPFDERELLVRIGQLLDSRTMLMKRYSDAMLGGEQGEQVNDNNDNSADPQMVFIARLSIAINNHLDDEDYFPDGLAAEMCLSVSQLYRKLKTMTGHTVSSFVMRTRLIKARQMLSKGDVSVKDAAFSCGFSNQSKDHMMRTVRQFLGFCYQNGQGVFPRIVARADSGVQGYGAFDPPLAADNCDTQGRRDQKNRDTDRDFGRHGQSRARRFCGCSRYGDHRFLSQGRRELGAGTPDADTERRQRPRLRD